MSNEIEKAQERRLSPVEAMLTERTDRLGTMLQASGIPVDRFIAAASVAALRTPELQKADQASLFSAVMQCANDGLVPNGVEAALTTFNNRKTGKVEVTYIPMIAGVFKKVRQSGEVKNLSATIVYANDGFEYFIDMEGEHFRHTPMLTGDRGAMIGVFAYATLIDGTTLVEYMPKADVEKVRKASRAGDNQYGPWVQWYDQMAKKSAIHRLAKRLPMSIVAQDVIARDNALYTFDGAEAPAPVPRKAQALPRAASQLEALNVPIEEEDTDPVDDVEVIIEAAEAEAPGDMF